MATFMLGLPVSNIIGAPASTWILDNIHYFGLSGWRWLFVLEGLPAVLFGIVTFFYLTDRPNEAKWLTEAERNWLVDEIKKEDEVKKDARHVKTEGYVLEHEDLAARHNLSLSRDGRRRIDLVAAYDRQGVFEGIQHVCRGASADPIRNRGHCHGILGEAFRQENGKKIPCGHGDNMWGRGTIYGGNGSIV